MGAKSNLGSVRGGLCAVGWARRRDGGDWGEI